MEITLKLYASLSVYLPEEAEKHAIRLTISPTDTVSSILAKFSVPKELTHLILLNGTYLDEAEREISRFSNGDTLAVWPPVAGG